MRIFIVHFMLSLISTSLFFRVVAISYHAFSGLLVFGISFFFLWLTTYFINKKYFKKIPKVASFFLFFMKELVVASLKVAYDIITPHYFMKPAVMAFPLEAKTDMEITILANLITLTPGTLSIDVSDDKKILYVHAIYIKDGDLEGLKNEIKNGFEKKLLEITR